MATLHHRTAPGTRPALPRRLCRAVLAAGVAVGLLLTTPAPALGDPEDDVAAAEAAERDLIAEVGRIQGEVTAAEEQLQRMTVEAEAAADAALVAQAELAAAQEAAAVAVARAAVDERDAAARAAAEAQAAADARLADAQADYDALAAQKAALDEQLRLAETELLRLRGIADAEAAWAAQQQAEQQAAVTVSVQSSGSGAAAPTTGRVTSCYGARWGTMHYGVDIAAPIGTPVFAPAGGVVLQAGPASGFGQAVYVQHDDGRVTVYGHVNQFFVSAGQVVGAGQQIAEVGNKGQSTGPHLHFEVHEGGLYASRVNPVPWLTARGISLGGC